jgi:FkbM family methyltransferase
MDSNTLSIKVKGVELRVNVKNFYKEFWQSIDHWEVDTFNIFNRFLNNKSSYLDIGAWIGPTVLYGAHKAKHVYALEPDPVAFQELIYNLDLNPRITSKVTCINAALGEKPGIIKLFQRNSLGDSMSSLIPTSSYEKYCEVIAISIDELSLNYNIKDINFIKMDIEAGEYFLIPALSKYLKLTRPTLNLSLHPPFLNDAATLQSIYNSNGMLDDINSIDQVSLTKRLVDSLDFYKYIYDSQGILVNKNTILNLTNHGIFVFTDEQW